MWVFRITAVGRCVLVVGLVPLLYWCFLFGSSSLSDMSSPASHLSSWSS